MTDADCPNCGGDNLTDYPVCPGCAVFLHFPERKICIHCERKDNGKNASNYCM